MHIEYKWWQVGKEKENKIVFTSLIQIRSECQRAYRLQGSGVSLKVDLILETGNSH